MKITFATGTTATKVGDKKPTRFYGGETEDIVNEQAQVALDEGIAVKAGTKEAKALAAKLLGGNPKTRRQDLDAKTPGLAARLARKAEAEGKVLSARDRLGELGEKNGVSKKKVADGVD